MHNNRITFLYLIICLVISVPLFMLVFNGVQYPYIFFDEKFYIELAQSFHKYRTFIYEGNQQHTSRALYAIIISTFFAFKQFTTSFRAIQVFNNAVYALSAIPVFLITTKLIDNQNKLTYAFLISIAFIVMPARLYANTAMPESLFLLFFLWLFYFTWQFLCKRQFWSAFSAFVFFILAFFTKQQIVIIVPAVFITLLVELFFNKKKKLMIFLLAGIFILISIIVIFYRKKFIPAHYFNLFSINLNHLLLNWKSFIAQILMLGWICGLLPFLFLIRAVLNLRKLSKRQRIFTVLSFSMIVILWIATSLYIVYISEIYNAVSLFSRYYICITPLLLISLTLNSQNLISQTYRNLICSGRANFLSRARKLIQIGAAITIFCCLTAYILPAFVAKRVDGNALSISGWHIKDKPLYFSAVLIGGFLFVWAMSQLFLSGNLKIYALIIGMLVLTIVASIRQKRYSSSISIPAIAISKMIDINVPGNAPLVYVGGKYDKSLFLTEILSPRHSKRFPGVKDNKHFLQNIFSPKFFKNVTYVLAPANYKLPVKPVSQTNEYSLYKLKMVQ